MSDDVKVDFQAAELESNDDINKEEVVTGPTYNESGWQDYVLSQLREDEKVVTSDGGIYPKCAGLRRLAELLLGDITFMGPTDVFVTNSVDGPGRATVVVKVDICWTRAGKLPVYVGGNNLDLPSRSFCAVADTWEGNTPAPYVNHTAATAESKALSRALKNALALNVHTAEEMTGNPSYKKGNAPQVMEEKPIEQIIEETAVSPVTKNQSAYLKNISNELGICPDKLVNMMFPGKKFNTADPKEMLTKKQASEAIQQLNNYKNNSADSEEIPESIKV